MEVPLDHAIDIHARVMRIFVMATEPHKSRAQGRMNAELRGIFEGFMRGGELPKCVRRHVPSIRSH